MPLARKGTPLRRMQDEYAALVKAVAPLVDGLALSGWGRVPVDDGARWEKFWQEYHAVLHELRHAQRFVLDYSGAGHSARRRTPSA